MCGIAGQVSASEPASPRLVERMCATLRHRGPDSAGLHHAERGAIGIRRLAIIDVPTGDQPLASEDGLVVVVCNGEIYNHRELRAELEARGHRFRTGSDAEVIPHLYEEHGRDLVSRLRGMFAFALWDERRSGLLLARDRVGKKPLHYHAADGTLSFASELAALLEDERIERRADPQALDAYLRYLYVPEPLSAIAGVRRVPPGSTLWWQDGEVDVARYWDLSYQPKQEGSPAELAARVGEHLDEAVRLRLMSERPLGAFLSGGVDSTAVVASMAAQASGTVRTFSIGFASERFNELPHARRVAELFATEHVEEVVELDPEAALPQLVEHYGEPFGDSSAIPSFAVAEAAAAHVTVALNGDGGDESLAGYNRYVSNAWAQRADRVPRPVLRAIAATVGALPEGTDPVSSRARVRRLARSLPLLPGPRYASRMTYVDDDLRQELYTPAFRAAVDFGATERLLSEPWKRSPAEAAVDRMLDVDVRTYLPGDLLVKMDIASMANSLEARSPFLDHVFMEMAARLPLSAKVRGRTTKVALKDSLRDRVPADLLDRPKWGFSVPLPDWFRGRLGVVCRDVMSDPRTRSREVVRPEVALRLLDDHRAGRADHASVLWLLTVLELWHRRFIDRLPATALF